MVISEKREHVTYNRMRNGKKHICHTTRKVYHIRCDSCGDEFYRDSKHFNQRSSAHCCRKCNPKRFAQRQSAILRQYDKWDASSSKTI
jgi:hypothetical protein